MPTLPSWGAVPLKRVSFRAFAAAFKLRLAMPCHGASKGSKYVLQLSGNLSLGFLTVPFLTFFSSASVLIQVLAFRYLFKAFVSHCILGIFNGRQKSELALG